VILYCLLTDEVPYEGVGGMSHRQSAFVSARRKNRLVWPSLDMVIARGLALDATQRYETTRAWVDELRAAGPTNRSWGIGWLR
jgi:hypothetical protein